MAPTAVNTSTTADYYTKIPEGVVSYILTSTTQNTTQTPTTPTTPDYDYDYPQTVPDFFWTGYTIYYVILFILVLLLPFLIIASVWCRQRQGNKRKLRVQTERARRQMEISISNNNVSSSGSCGNVCIDTDNNMSILPKGMDLPPSYDELNYNNDVKQPGGLGASMLTIATDLESSNPNLVAAYNEPPPDYEIGAIGGAAATTTTTTTTTTVVVTGPPLPRESI